MRTTTKFEIKSAQDIKNRLLIWAQEFEEIAWLDSNDYGDKNGKYKAILAVDAFTAIKTDYKDAFAKLEEYQKTTNDWLFGYLTYDLKNDVERLVSNNHDGLDFADLQFFQPKKIFLISENEITLHYLNMLDDEIESDWEDILNCEVSEDLLSESEKPALKISLRTSKDSYYSKAETLKDHISRGDLYEANLCQEFYAEDATIDPIKTFLQLNHISKSPFATFLRFGSHYTLSASPERYLKKSGNQVISQPIKGTAKRLPTSEEDLEMVQKLLNDTKERSENIMITDLVRNDLSRIAKKGSVTVDELCAIYTFEQVHQMISTVRCEVAEDLSPVKIIQNTFPMGSMTGAPKVSAMQIIEKLEDAKRGLYSGAVGYFEPNGDFDFNVIIRSILYNVEKKYVSYSVGSAITDKSVIENEYEECLLKAKAMRQVLES